MQKTIGGQKGASTMKGEDRKRHELKRLSS